MVSIVLRVRVAVRGGVVSRTLAGYAINSWRASAYYRFKAEIVLPILVGTLQSPHHLSSPLQRSPLNSESTTGLNTTLGSPVSDKDSIFREGEFRMAIEFDFHIH